MTPLKCELCGSGDFVKDGEFFVCQHCKTKYTKEEAQKIMGTVKIDNTDKLSNLYQVARRARDNNDAVTAEKYYDNIMSEDPLSWEAAFYTVFFRAKQCKIAEIGSAGTNIVNNIESVFRLIKDTVPEKDDEQRIVCLEVEKRINEILPDLYMSATNYYNELPNEIRNDHTQEFLNWTLPLIQGLFLCGDTIEKLWPNDDNMGWAASRSWLLGVRISSQIIQYLSDKENSKTIINTYVNKIKKYDSSYNPPEIIERKKGGCYVATCIYGSYDCPQVWILRRYRDNTLSKTCYGRAFIHTYYAISPTLVKWFGDTVWFKQMWKPKLDTMVENLKNNGVESTPYQDIEW